MLSRVKHSATPFPRGQVRLLQEHLQATSKCPRLPGSQHSSTGPLPPEGSRGPGSRSGRGRGRGGDEEKGDRQARGRGGVRGRATRGDPQDPSDPSRRGREWTPRGLGGQRKRTVGARGGPERRLPGTPPRAPGGRPGAPEVPPAGEASGTQGCITVSLMGDRLQAAGPLASICRTMGRKPISNLFYRLYE